MGINPEQSRKNRAVRVDPTFRLCRKIWRLVAIAGIPDRGWIGNKAGGLAAAYKLAPRLPSKVSQDGGHRRPDVDLGIAWQRTFDPFSGRC
jgi:hypothetical protein